MLPALSRHGWCLEFFCNFQIPQMGRGGWATNFPRGSASCPRREVDATCGSCCFVSFYCIHIMYFVRILSELTRGNRGSRVALHTLQGERSFVGLVGSRGLLAAEEKKRGGASRPRGTKKRCVFTQLHSSRVSSDEGPRLQQRRDDRSSASRSLERAFAPISGSTTTFAGSRIRRREGKNIRRCLGGGRCRRS